jgi:hypothetical protein
MPYCETRDSLLKEHQIVSSRIAELKSDMGLAAARARNSGVYEDPEVFHARVREIQRAKRRVQHIQQELGRLKREDVKTKLGRTVRALELCLEDANERQEKIIRRALADCRPYCEEVANG